MLFSVDLPALHATADAAEDLAGTLTEAARVLDGGTAELADRLPGWGFPTTSRDLVAVIWLPDQESARARLRAISGALRDTANAYALTDAANAAGIGG
ncbi:hypothetical protein Afil01_42460 [Actinorhabdospora filicis]|uniref:Uncharacterized protein n=1 Tax=Actinorhabdospora filicis TaxID=1785913 RepID=A0A9W6SM26_9ACTN|nr:hypothetical protein [Actinorhabdospora filicis]GLZ79439.1 hypothetical protein Afil01_42460 [Actinorhabdospora filicis]